MAEPAGAPATGRTPDPATGRTPRPTAGRTPRPLRCAAVGLHLDPDRATSAAELVGSVADLLDRELPVDTEVDTLVALPEHTGLLAMLVGERGAAARTRWREGGSTLEILFALAGSYGEVLGALAQRYPEVRSAGQLIHLACTDTVVRTLVEGLGELAARRGIWLSVCAALPRWELVAVGGGGAADQQPRDGQPQGQQPAGRQLAALLAGPQGTDRSHVAVPTGPAVRNRQLLLAPWGELVAVHDKVSLVPLEADGEAGLGLEPASLAEVAVADLPIGRVGTVISKDAWMPDVNERLAQLGAQILLQPEAFDRWGVPDADPSTGQRDLWPPDKFQRGGWWMLQRHPSFRVNLAPMLLGALGELAFDGQPLVAVPSPGGDPRLGLLGQPPDTGWAAVGPWWRERAAGRAVSRAAAGRAVEQPLPRAPCDEVAVARLVLPSDHAPGHASDPLSRHPGVSDSIEVAPEPGAVQLVPELVAGEVADTAAGAGEVADAVAGPGAEPQRVWLAWVACDATGRQQLRLAAGNGRGWEPSQAVSPDPEDGVDPVTARRWRPRLAVDRGVPVCCHLGFPVGSWDVLAVRPGQDPAAPVRVDDADTDEGVLRERLHDAPAIVADDDGLVAVWSDLRWPWVLPQVRIARSRDGGATWSASARVDGGSLLGEQDPLAGRSAAESSGQTSPSVAVCDGEVVVAWQERDAAGAPTIRLAWPERCAPRGPDPGPDRGPVRGPDGGPDRRWVRTLAGAAPGDALGASPGVSAAPAGTSGGFDRVGRPVLAAAGSTLWAVWEVWSPEGGAALWAAVSLDAGRRWSPPRLLDPSRPAGARQQRACVVPVGPDGAVAVMEDDRGGSSSVVTITLRALGPDELTATTPLRVDDAPPEAHARAPAAARLADGLVVVWQDTRSGTELLRSAHLRLED